MHIKLTVIQYQMKRLTYLVHSDLKQNLNLLDIHAKKDENLSTSLGLVISRMGL